MQNKPETEGSPSKLCSRAAANMFLNAALTLKVTLLRFRFSTFASGQLVVSQHLQPTTTAANQLGNTDASLETNS